MQCLCSIQTLEHKNKGQQELIMMCLCKVKTKDFVMKHVYCQSPVQIPPRNHEIYSNGKRCLLWDTVPPIIPVLVWHCRIVSIYCSQSISYTELLHFHLCILSDNLLSLKCMFFLSRSCASPSLYLPLFPHLQISLNLIFSLFSTPHPNCLRQMPCWMFLPY